MRFGYRSDSISVTTGSCSGQWTLAEYEDDVVTIQCPECDRGNCRFCFPLGGIVDGFRERLTKVLDRWLQNRYPSNADGIWDNGTAAIES